MYIDYPFTDRRLCQLKPPLVRRVIRDDKLLRDAANGDHHRASEIAIPVEAKKKIISGSSRTSRQHILPKDPRIQYSVARRLLDPITNI